MLAGCMEVAECEMAGTARQGCPRDEDGDGDGNKDGDKDGDSSFDAFGQGRSHFLMCSFAA